MSYMKKEEYLRTLAEQIRCKQARAQVVQELRSHIEEQEEFYLGEGLTKEEAEDEAVREMGDPVEAGTALDLIHKPRMAWGWIGLIGLIYIACYVILSLLQSNFSEENFITHDYIKWLPVSLVVMVGVCYADYSRIGRWAREITIVAFAALFAGMYLFGEQVNGGLRWVNLPILSAVLNVQLLCFLFVPLYAAIVYHYHGQGYLAVGKCFLWMLPAVVLALKIPSAMTALMLLVTFFFILSFAIIRGWFRGAKGKMLAAVWGGSILLVAIGYLKLFFAGPAYQYMRVRVLLNQSREGGYHRQLLRGILEGCRWIGGGEGENAVKAADGFMEGIDHGLLYIIACYGILAAILVIGLLISVFVFFMGTSVGQKNHLGSIMGFGCAAVLIVQIVFYVLENTGTFPLGVVYCPFLTSGGTGVLVTNTLIGILLSIYRYQDVPLDGEKGNIRQLLSMKRTVY